MILPGMELKDNILVSGNADSTVKIWDILSGQCLQTLSGRKLQVKQAVLYLLFPRSQQTPVSCHVSPVQ